VYQTCPQALLPVLPRLVLELRVEDPEKRMAAVDLLGRLFSIPGSDMDVSYQELLGELLRRLKDNQVCICNVFVPHCPS
jgi:hypothetical protein